MIWANVTKFGQNFIASPKFFWAGTAMALSDVFEVCCFIFVINTFLIVARSQQFVCRWGGTACVDGLSNAQVKARQLGSIPLHTS